MCFIPYHGSSRAYWSLTSFKTILLDCIVTAVISACTLKNVTKLVNFCVAILISMEENMQHFSVLCFIVLRKVKMQLKHKKRLDDKGSVTERVKSVLPSFLVLLTFWQNYSLLWGRLMHWKMFSSTPGPYPLGANRER